MLGLLGLGAGALGGWARGKSQARQQKQDWEKQVALDRYLNPNRTLGEALKQNVQGNFLQNLGLMDPSQMGRGGTYGAFLQSLRGGINPQLQGEFGNISRIPGLTLGGELVGEDPSKMFQPKGPGFLESLGLGAASLFGG